MVHGIGYAVIAALIWGSELYILKRRFADLPAAVLTVCINAAALAWYTPVAILVLDVDAVPSLGALGVVGIAASLTAIGATAMAFVLFLYAIAAGEVSYVAPINKIAPVFVVPLEVVLLGEELTPLQLAGVVIATLAVYVANYRPGTGGLTSPFRRAAVSRPAQLAVVSAGGFAAADFSRRVALQEAAVPPPAFVLVMLAGVLVVLVPRAYQTWRPVGDRLPELVGLGALVAVGEHTTSMAFSLVPASVASPVVNTQAIVAVVLGGVLLGERYFRIRLIAAVLAVVGVALIAL
ncbi:MAG: EamA family transporter [Halobacteriaceae archaeon]